MNVEDVDVAWAERDASPTRWRTYDTTDHLPTTYEQIHQAREERTRSRHGSRPGTDVVEEAEAVEPREETGAPLEEIETKPVRHGDGPHGTPGETGSLASSSSVSSVRREESRGQSSRSARQRHMSTISKSSTKMERDLMDYLDRHPTAVSRIEQHRLQHMQTVGGTKAFSREGIELPDFGGGKPYPPPLPEREEYVVEFSGFDDPRHAQNFPMKKKLRIASVLVFFSFAATFASSIFSAGSQSVEKHFNQGREVVTLGTSLFVLGYAVGPSVFAPISELYGRRVPVIFAAAGFGIFNTAVAAAKDYQTLCICRFFGGFMGSCPLALCGAVFADMFDNKIRGIAIAMFSATVIAGPLTAPMIGGFITKSYLGWRWTAWIPAFMGYAAAFAALFFQDETYGPVVLVSKASELRRLTRNWGIHAKQEEVEVDIKELAIKNISRPLRILFTEPIVLVITVYMSFIYGLLYLSLTAYALVFEEVYQFSLGVAGIPYLAMVVGVLIGLVTIILMNKSYIKKLEANNNIPVPEWRLPIAMPGGIIFAVGLFWFGWGGYQPDVSYWVPTIAGIFLGFGIYTVFLQCLNYVIDAYLMFAASAIAANTIMRSLFGAVFPLFAYYMFAGIGIEWGMTFLGCMALLFVPMPFLLYRYGRKLRAMSKFAPAPDIEQDKRRDEESRGAASEAEESRPNGTSSASEANDVDGKKEE